MPEQGFPNSPAVNDTTILNGMTYKFNGSAWDKVAGAVSTEIPFATQVDLDAAVADIATKTTESYVDTAVAAVSVTPAAVCSQANTSTEYFDLPSGTTAQRPISPNDGMIRFNTTLAIAEYYDGVSWKAIDNPPLVLSTDTTEVDSTAGDITIIITGSGFSSGAVIKFIGSNSTEITASSTAVNSETQITAVVASSSFTDAAEPYGIKVINSSGMSGILENQINIDAPPVWSTASGQVGGSLYEGDAISFNIAATDADGDAISYSETTSTLSGSGLSLSTSGTISGTGTSVSSDTTYSFTARATANNKTVDRSFNTVIKNDSINDASFYTNYAFYQFNGNANDSGYGRNGSAYNMTYPTAPAKSAGFQECGAFNGSNSYINTNFVRPSSPKFTMALWFKTDVTGKYFWGDVGGAYNIVWTCYLESPTNVRVVSDGPGGPTYHIDSIAPYALNDNAWHHLTVVGENDSQFSIYIDGALVGNGGGYSRTGVNSILLGSYSTTSGSWNGYLDQVRCTADALSSGQVAALYDFENNR